MFRLRCFGRAVVEDPDGEEVRLRSQKHLALLLYLANERGTRYSRERLASLFWETESRLARHSLSQALYDITQNLPSLDLHRSVRDVGLGEDGLAFEGETFDAAVREERLDEAVDLYLGSFAPGLEDAGGEDFERWLDAERHRYRRLAETALLRHMSRCDDQARWGEMYHSATRLLKMNPLSEEAHRAFMRALWLQGNQEAAVAHFEAEHERLERELPGGISEETHDLVKRIRGSRPALAASAVHETARLPMVGREEEFGTLKRLLAETLEGEGRLAIVHGEAGMGKTRLLEEFHEFAALEGARVLESRCYSAETDVPFGPVVDGLGEIATEFAERGSDDVTYHQLGHLFPEVFEATSHQLDSFLGAGAGRRRLYEEVADLTRRSCTDQPIVWLIDDAHWMDASSTSLVHYLVRRLAEQPVMIVCAVRDGENDFVNHLRDWDEEGKNHRRTEMFLKMLGLEEIEVLIERFGPNVTSSASAHQVYKLTGGNPLYIKELLHPDVVDRLLESDIDDSPFIGSGAGTLDYSERLTMSLRRKVSGLSPIALRILEVAAVAGRSTSLKLLTDASGYDKTTVYENVGTLYKQGLLIDREGYVGFSHDLLRSYIYSTLGEIQRSALHLTVGELLAKGDSTEEYRALAHHFSEAGDTDRAYEYSLLAAQRALASNAHEQAIHLAQSALRYCRDPESRAPVLKILADAEVAAGKLSAADSTLREVLSLQGVGTEDWINTRLQLADLLLDRSHLKEALEVLEQLTSQLRSGTSQGSFDTDHEGVDRLAWAEHLYAKALLKTGQFPQAAQALTRIDGLVSSKSDPSANIQVISSISHAAYELLCGMPESAVGHLESSSAWIGEADYELKLKATFIASLVFQSIGEWDRGERWLERAECWTQEFSDVTNLLGILNNKVVYSLEKGEWEQVRLLTDRVASTYAGHDRTANASVALTGNLGHACFFSGETENAIGHYEKALSRISPSENPGLSIQYQCCLALACLQGRNFVRAERLWGSVLETAGLLVKPRPEIQEYYKYFWLKTYFGILHGKQDCIDQLVSVGREAGKRNKPDSLKILWLAALLELGSDRSGGLTRSEIRGLPTYHNLKEHGMQWFAFSTNRWLVRANSVAHAQSA